MALVYPFKAYRYNPEVAPFERVLTQPYDKISPAMQEKYYAAHPNNLITIEKGRSLRTTSTEQCLYTCCFDFKGLDQEPGGSAGRCSVFLCLYPGIYGARNTAAAHTAWIYRSGKAGGNTLRA